MLKLSMFVLFCTLSTVGLSQSADLGSWTILQLGYRANDNLTIKLSPITRRQNNLSDYTNTSVDLSLHYKFNKQWSAMILERLWFMPNQGDRTFFFFQTNYKHKLNEKWGLVHQLRYHLALDLTREDPDFIRYLPRLTYKIKKWTPFIGLDFFYRIINPQNLAGMRYQTGFNRSLKNDMALNLQYWYQQGMSETPVATSHLIVLKLSKTFTHSKTDDK